MKREPVCIESIPDCFGEAIKWCEYRCAIYEKCVCYPSICKIKTLACEEKQKVKT